MHTTLTPEVIREHLADPGLAGWQLEQGQLVKCFRFGSYMDGIHFTRRIAELAEAMNHHPDLLVRWREVTVRIHTHSAGGVTALDVEFAARAQQV